MAKGLVEEGVLEGLGDDFAAASGLLGDLDLGKADHHPPTFTVISCGSRPGATGLGTPGMV